MKNIVKKFSLPIGLVVIVFCFVWYFFKLFDYTLTVTISDENDVKIQTLSLGEYYTQVRKLDIYESETSHKVVSLIAKSDSSRMHTVTLATGINRFDDMYLDRYSIIYTEGNPYVFKYGAKYLLKVDWGTSEKETSFVFPNGTYQYIKLTPKASLRYALVAIYI